VSRKRDAKREAQRELARQLGVAKEAVPEELRAHARVTQPELRATLDVAEAKRGLFTKKRPFVAHVALYVVDAAGARLARSARFDGMIERVPGEHTLHEVVADGARELVRYTRPGHFVALVVGLEGGEPALHDAIAKGLTDPEGLTIALQASVVHVGDRAMGKVEEPCGVELAHAGRPLLPSEGVTYGASAALSIAAAHRVHVTPRIPLHSHDGRLHASLLLDCRL
jgi:hypothetical protein